MTWSVFEQDMLSRRDRSGAEGAERRVGRPLLASGRPMAWLRLGLRRGDGESSGSGVCAGGSRTGRRWRGGFLCQGGSLQEGLLQDVPFQQKFEG